MAGSCRLGEHETGMTDVAATAGGPIDVDLPGQFPTVGLGVWKYDDELEPYVILSLDHLNVNAKMRPRELRQLAGLATRLANAVEGVTR
ncbi:hypothetical protein [Kineococcus sp. R86509]|uniref:hypothetical protein n=1 Tax=Kineococcus sp. R86509 TaxID=3093851 RepID=UPI0036D3FAB1